MSDLFRVCVFVPVASEGDASTGIQAAIQIALELGFGVDVHPMILCPNADDSAPASGVRLSEGSFSMTGG